MDREKGAQMRMVRVQFPPIVKLAACSLPLAPLHGR